jgi:TolA-binding protein
LQVARAKYDAGLYDQALADLKDLVARNPTSASAPTAYLLMASTYARQNRGDDSAATYVELRTKYKASAAAAEGTYNLAELTLTQKRNDREQVARELFTDIVTNSPNSPFAPKALVARAALEERAKLRVVDAQLSTSVPASLISYRMLVEKYPAADGSEAALAKLADQYEDLKRYELAAQTLDLLAARFPRNTRDAAWRAAEMYDKRVKNPEAARAAYARVPESSTHYREAQKRAQR